MFVLLKTPRSNRWHELPDVIAVSESLHALKLKVKELNPRIEMYPDEDREIWRDISLQYWITEADELVKVKSAVDLATAKPGLINWHGRLALQDTWSNDHRKFKHISFDVPMPITYTVAGSVMPQVVGKVDRIERYGKELYGYGTIISEEVVENLRRFDTLDVSCTAGEMEGLVNLDHTIVCDSVELKSAHLGVPSAWDNCYIEEDVN